jgi:hypothetical protein
LGLRFNDNAIRCAPSRWQREILLAARKKRQGQNRLPGFIRYDHESQIIAAALFSQASRGKFGELTSAHRIENKTGRNGRRDFRFVRPFEPPAFIT